MQNYSRIYREFDIEIIEFRYPKQRSFQFARKNTVI